MYAVKMHCRERDLAIMIEMWYRRTILCYQLGMWAVMLNEAVHTKVVTLIWGRFLERNILGIWSAWLCFHVNRVVWDLVPNTGDNKAQPAKFRLHSNTNSPICSNQRKYCTMSPKRLGNFTYPWYITQLQNNYYVQPTVMGIRDKLMMFITWFPT